MGVLGPATAPSVPSGTVPTEPGGTDVSAGAAAAGGDATWYCGCCGVVLDLSA